MKKLLLTVAAGIGLLASNATANANGSKYLEPAPVAAGSPCAFFGGFYMGAHAGANLYRADRNDDDGYLTDNSGHARTDDAFIGGIQAGYTKQRGCTIFGIEGDASWSSAEGEFIDDPNQPAIQGIDAEMESLYTLRVRSGVVVNNLMLYATGGLAAAKIKNTYFEDSPVFESFSFSDTRWGFALGAGAEWAINDRWSLKGEGLYVRLEEDTETFNSANGPANFQFTENDSAWIGRLGLNYRFGGDMHRATGSKSLKPAVTASSGPCAFFGGFYMGVSGGGAYYRADRNDDDGFLTDNGGHARTDDGGIIGAQAGYLKQRGCTIFGVEGGGNWASSETRFEDNPNAPDNNGITTEIDSIYTLRLKSGVVVDNMFIYATGGLASAEIDSNYFDPPLAGSFSDRRWGWVTGLGTEWALGGRWSLKAEGLYMQFEEETDRFNAGGTDFQFTANDSIWVARAGLNYRLGGADIYRGAPDGSKSFKPAVASSPGPCAMFGGFYMGAHGSAVRYRADRNDDDGFLTDNAGHARTEEEIGGGGQVGYNMQRDCNFFGIEADGTWGSTEANFVDNPNAPPGDNRIDAEIDSIYTLRAKAGLVVENLAMYVTGGLASADIKSDYADPPLFSSHSDRRWGWVGGLGTEWAINDRWSLKSEALYMQFEEETDRFNAGGNNFVFTANDSVWIGRLGLNYKIGGPRN